MASVDLGSAMREILGAFYTQRNIDLGDRTLRAVSGYVFLLICLPDPTPRRPLGEGCGHRSLGPHHLPGDVCVECCCQGHGSGLSSYSLGKSLNLGKQGGGKVKRLVYRELGVE